MNIYQPEKCANSRERDEIDKMRNNDLTHSYDSLQFLSVLEIFPIPYDRYC